MIHCVSIGDGADMAREPGLFDIDARLRELSAKGDDLERVNALVDFETFRSELEQAVPRADRAKGAARLTTTC